MAFFAASAVGSPATCSRSSAAVAKLALQTTLQPRSAHRGRRLAAAHADLTSRGFSSRGSGGFMVSRSKLSRDRAAADRDRDRGPRGRDRWEPREREGHAGRERDMALASRGTDGDGALTPRGDSSARSSSSTPAVRLSPAELSSAVRVASQGKRVGDLRLWKEYAEAVLFHAGSLQPKHVAYITNGFARAQVPDRDVFRRLADRALEQVGEFEPQYSALVLNAYARLAFRDPVLFQGFSKAIRSAPAADWGFGEQQLSLVANAYARLELYDTALFSTLSTWIARKAAKLSPQGVSTIANAYAKVLAKDFELFGQLSPTIQRHMSVLQSQDVANILHAYGKLRLQDGELVGQLAARVPSLARELRPIEVAAISGALVKLETNEGSHRRALISIAAVLREQASSFRARQLSSTLHAFSTLTVTHSDLFVDMAPHVLSCSPDADSQGLTLLFCAYARAGQPVSRVLDALIDRLEPRVDSLQTQALVNLFYACGRLALHKDSMALRLAEVLRPLASTLEAQHATNCLFAVARLGVSTDEYASLAVALLARVTHGRLALEPQQCANALYALALLHSAEVSARGRPGDSQSQSPCAVAAASVIQRVLDTRGNREWMERPQLLASVCDSCARLGEAPAPVFALASRAVRESERRRGETGGGRSLSHQCVADLLVAFAAVDFFDVDVFSWAMSRLPPDDPGAAVPMASLLRALDALDYLSCGAAGKPTQRSQKLSSSALDDIDMEVAEHAFSLFSAFPPAFQDQARRFYAGVGRALLGRSGDLRASELERAAVSFARAGCLDDVPFDLLSARERRRAQEAATVRRQLDLFGSVASAPEAEASALLTELSDESSNFGQDGATVLDQLLANISEKPSLELPEQCEAVACARILARYASLLARREDARSQAAIPAAVLDAIVARLTGRLAQAATSLPFEDAAEALGILSDVGVLPRAAVGALVESAEATFPESPWQESVEAINVSFRTEEVQRSAAAVAALLRSLRAANIDAASLAFRSQLLEYSSGLAKVLAHEVVMKADQGLPLGERPLRALAAFVSFLPEVGEGSLRGVSDASTRLFLSAGLDRLLIPMLDSSDSLSDGEVVACFDDLNELQVALAHRDNRGTLKTRESDALREGTASAIYLLLANLLMMPTAKTGVPSPRRLDLLRSLAAAQVSCLDGATLMLLCEITSGLSANAQSLGPAALASSLDALARLRLPASLPDADDVRTAFRECADVAAATLRSTVDASSSGVPDARAAAMSEVDKKVLEATEGVRSRLPAATMVLLRALTARTRSLSPSEAVCGAHFCAFALDARALSEDDRDEIADSLSHLLERACWERRRWSPEDGHVVASIGTLLRSEYPEMLRSGSWTSRAVLATLEEMRASGSGSRLGL
eukprot:TRINITY_DN23069_c0_g1_i1.p1 TRINITY_DN23069_c0_g1~~TRINITY_DN23069_c0_g1_i1.p1  ORF type:complete len:1387 (+),score=237.94 TRINITY_DN23069_c0_g1_i1:185-4345(+)